jgi:hypothetical protein
MMSLSLVPLFDSLDIIFFVPTNLNWNFFKCKFEKNVNVFGGKNFNQKLKIIIIINFLKTRIVHPCFHTFFFIIFVKKI